MISSDYIKEYPTNFLSKVIYIIFVCLKEMLGIRSPGKIIEEPDKQENNLNEIPVVKALTYYEWIYDSDYEIFLR